MRNINEPLISIVMSAFNAGDFLKDAIVVAPSIWFKDGSNDTDLIPADWIRL